MTIVFSCPTCGSELRAPDEYAGKLAKCKNCQNRLTIPSTQEPEILLDSTSTSGGMQLDYHQQLEQSGFPAMIHGIPIAKLSAIDAKQIWEWGFKMFQIASSESGTIDEIKYDGHIIVMDDGTRWEVDDIDTGTAEFWDTGDRVVVVDDRMYRLDESESVAVQKD